MTGLRWGFAKPAAPRPQDNPVIRLARKFFPSPPASKADVSHPGQRPARLTPLALVLLAVETTDLIFAVDSIPAIFAVTQNAFIVFTSNIFAILGLRSLYFVHGRGALQSFRYLRTGLAAVLVVVGLKMLAVALGAVPTSLSLGLVASDRGDGRWSVPSWPGRHDKGRGDPARPNAEIHLVSGRDAARTLPATGARRCRFRLCSPNACSIAAWANRSFSPQFLQPRLKNLADPFLLPQHGRRRGSPAGRAPNNRNCWSFSATTMSMASPPPPC